MCVRVLQPSARKAFSLWLCCGLGCPRGLQNLCNCRLLTKSTQMSLRSQARRAGPASHRQLYPAAQRSCCPTAAWASLRAVWKMERHRLRWNDLHGTSWLFYSCSFSSCRRLRFRSLPLVAGAAGERRLLCSGPLATLPSRPGQRCSPGASSREKSPGGVAGTLQAGSQRRAGHGRSCSECRAPGAGHDPFQGLLFHGVPLEGFTFWERENNLAEEFHTEAIGKLFYITQPQHWSEGLVIIIEFPLLCPVQG